MTMLNGLIRPAKLDSVLGTSFFGDSILATQNQLEETLGIEHRKTPDGKCHCEWKLYINDLPCCVYDWKEDYEPDQEIYWHVGARNQNESKKITKIINDMLNAK